MFLYFLETLFAISSHFNNIDNEMLTFFNINPFL